MRPLGREEIAPHIYKCMGEASFSATPVSTILQIARSLLNSGA
jgi:hypothetical protein